MFRGPFRFCGTFLGGEVGRLAVGGGLVGRRGFQTCAKLRYPEERSDLRDVSVLRGRSVEGCAMIIEINKPELESLLLDRMARADL